jgi:NAD(P)-dependent dehydrogenase (short-subunit alcohol dehydrogenase family)
VLILGASGGSGIIGVQIAKQLGAHVVAVCSGKNAEFVKAHGADKVSSSQSNKDFNLSYHDALGSMLKCVAIIPRFLITQPRTFPLLRCRTGRSRSSMTVLVGHSSCPTSRICSRPSLPLPTLSLLL